MSKILNIFNNLPKSKNILNNGRYLFNICNKKMELNEEEKTILQEKYNLNLDIKYYNKIIDFIYKYKDRYMYEKKIGKEYTLPDRIKLRKFFISDNGVIDTNNTVILDNDTIFGNKCVVLLTERKNYEIKYINNHFYNEKKVNKTILKFKNHKVILINEITNDNDNIYKVQIETKETKTSIIEGLRMVNKIIKL